MRFRTIFLAWFVGLIVIAQTPIARMIIDDHIHVAFAFFLFWCVGLGTMIIIDRLWDFLSDVWDFFVPKEK